MELLSRFEGQLNLRWASINALNFEEFPEANRKIFSLIPS